MTAFAPSSAGGRLARVLRRAAEARAAPALLARLKADTAHPAIAALDEVATVRSNERGSVLFGRRRGEPWSAVIKLYAGDGAPERVDRLFEHHRLAHDRMRDDPEYSVPEPLVRFADPPGYAMRHVAGRSASSVAKWAVRHRARTQAALLARAAEWLDRYHRGCDRHASRVSPGYLVNQLAKSADPGGKYAAIPRFAEFQEMLDGLRETAGRLGTFPFPKAVLHGDFNLHNIVVDDGRTWGIDFASGPNNVRPVTFDVANCLFFLEFRDAWRAGDRAGVPGGFDRRAVEVFARHYPDLPWTSAGAAWLLLYHQVQFWARLGHLNMERQVGKMASMCRQGARTLADRL